MPSNELTYLEAQEAEMYAQIGARDITAVEYQRRHTCPGCRKWFANLGRHLGFSRCADDRRRRKATKN
jgi:hypothetical protein